MSWGMIIGGVVAAGGAIIGGQQGADAAESAASTQASASTESARLQNEAQLRLEARMQPYIATGNAANTYINALLGLPATQSGGGTGQPVGGPDYAAYVRANPDLLAAWENGGSQIGSRATGMSIEDFGRLHWQGGSNGNTAWGGQNEGRTLPTFQSQAQTPADQGATYDAAMGAYEESPWARFAEEGAETARANANESFMSTAGARGSIVSGRTAAGLYEIAQEAEDERFREGFTEGWWPAMTGVSDRGYNASVGVGNSSLSTAANVGAAGERAASATANGERDGADAMASGINSALYYAGQGWDAWTNRAPRMDTSPDAANGNAKPQKYAKSGGSKYSGG